MKLAVLQATELLQTPPPENCQRRTLSSTHDSAVRARFLTGYVCRRQQVLPAVHQARFHACCAAASVAFSLPCLLSCLSARQPACARAHARTHARTRACTCRYLRQSQAREPDALRITAHTDESLLTLLWPAPGEQLSRAHFTVAGINAHSPCCSLFTSPDPLCLSHDCCIAIVCS